MGIKIVTDSTSYIPENIAKELDIKVVSLNVIMGEKSYREVELANEDFYEQMEKLGEIPTSSQPSIEEVKSAFEEIVKNGDVVVGIFISSDMSGTYQTANMIKNMVLEEYKDGEIYILDSRSNCMQTGYVAIEAARAAKESLVIEEVIKRANNVIENSRFLFMPETLKYLKKGGRIGSAAALLGGILKIVPILTVEDGKTTVFNKVRTRKRAINTIVDSVISDIKKKGVLGVTVHHINCEKEGMNLKNELQLKLKEEGYEVPVLLESIGPIIGLHVGPGSIGVVYYTKN
ncbi:fatty acid-binding protein DegV [Clostridium baratii]|uniref:DegV family protein n=1 Tax=Clostridium baratii TaxID=1561 RepID=A0A174VGQ5_9CLOT|nr:DegV family protein [Clostridium baratii]OPF52875.1 fatty acid-binding protein DegV [Clostridium baratii]OPF56322.1 fatty acid-binding protein DegV [Clostridium baratii]OPF58083.1 fatty acid-binding protein DegV [Clostridium baratii]OPF59296.1 fatty acid-binding protein DegV [Clostridium baratii]CUQ31278.1 DegV family protein [Clostridium baratii]